MPGPAAFTLAGLKLPEFSKDRRSKPPRQWKSRDPVLFERRGKLKHCGGVIRPCPSCRIGPAPSKPIRDFGHCRPELIDPRGGRQRERLEKNPLLCSAHWNRNLADLRPPGALGNFAQSPLARANVLLPRGAKMESSRQPAVAYGAGCARHDDPLPTKPVRVRFILRPKADPL